MSKVAILHPTIRNAIDWREVNDKTPGDCSEGKVAVVNARGERVAHMGRSGGAAVARRLLQSPHPIVRGKHEGRDAWIEKPSARKTVTVADQQLGALDKAVHDASVLAAKGSVTHHPTKPEKARRPERGG